MKLAPPVEAGSVLSEFASLFTRPTLARVQALVCGALLCSTGTVTAALRALGLGGDLHFQNYHRVLNRARWSAFAASRVLLKLLVDAFAPAGEPLAFGLDETVERRWGPRITARAIYRDASRSSKECVQKTSGLRWLSLQLLVPVSWSGRIWALPFLTALCPSERYGPFVKRGRKHKPLPRRTRGFVGAAWRWMKDANRLLVFVADKGYSALELLAWCARLAKRDASRTLAFVTGLRLDAALYEPAPARPPGAKGRPRLKGARLPTLAKRLADPAASWERVSVAWYGNGGERIVEIASDTCVWYHNGLPPVPIRWVLVRDPEGKFEPRALLCTHLPLAPKQVVEAYVRRWQMEVTFEEVNARLGLPGQRQWNDLAVERSTPVRLALFSFVALVVEREQQAGSQPPVRQAAWRPKALPTFSDALAQVRRLLWRQIGFCMSRSDPDSEKPNLEFIAHLAETLAYAA